MSDEVEAEGAGTVDSGSDDGFSSGGTEGLGDSGGMDNPEGFDPPDGEPIEDEQESEDSPDAPDASDDEAVEDAPDEAPSGSPAAEEVQPYQPYTLKAGNGPEIAVPGVFKNPVDGSLYVHPDAVEGLNRVIQDARLREETRKENYQLRRQIAQVNHKVDENAVRNANTAKFWEDLMKDPQKAWEFLNEYQAKKPILDAANEKAVAQAYYQAGQQLRAPDPQAQAQQLQADQEATIRKVVGDSMQQYNQLGLSPDDWEELGDWLDENRSSLFLKATKEHAQMHPNIREGQWVQNGDYVQRSIQRFLAWKGKAKENAASVSQAQSYNAKRAGQTAGKRPPQALSNRPPQRQAPKERVFKSRKEWQDHLFRQEDGDQIRSASA